MNPCSICHCCDSTVLVDSLTRPEQRGSPSVCPSEVSNEEGVSEKTVRERAGCPALVSLHQHPGKTTG